jgi:hypothetical protein
MNIHNVAHSHTNLVIPTGKMIKQSGGKGDNELNLTLRIYKQMIIF